jgi:hypothetical protein
LVADTSSSLTQSTSSSRLASERTRSYAWPCPEDDPDYYRIELESYRMLGAITSERGTRQCMEPFCPGLVYSLRLCRRCYSRVQRKRRRTCLEKGCSRVTIGPDMARCQYHTEELGLRMKPEPKKRKRIFVEAPSAGEHSDGESWRSDNKRRRTVDTTTTTTTTTITI